MMKNITKEAITPDNVESIKEYFESIISCMPGNVYWMDVNSVYRGCNDNVARLLKLGSCQDVVGMTYEKMALKTKWDSKIISAFRSADIEVVQSGLPKTNIEEPPIINDDGSLTYFLTNRVPFKNKNGDVIGIVGISIDITDRKKLESELLIAKEKAEAANYAKSEFIANMGHDLKTPFAGISGIADALYSVYSDQYPELKPLLEDMIKSCTQWEEVHKRIINSINLGDNEFKLKKFHIYDEVHKIADMMSATLSLKSLKLIILPLEQEGSDLIETDPLKLHLILLNLIGNAINFTENGIITVSMLQENNLFKIEITDTGTGIPDDKFGYIFEQFTKLSRSNRYGATFKGVGSGLYISREYAQRLGGGITVKSTLNKGSTFTLSLPINPQFIDK